jgi:aspartate-semialdehyde dehydrogenase
VEEYTLVEARKCQLIFLAVSGDFALANGKALTEGDGPVVIDNSSAFRYMPDIPLVVSTCPMTSCAAARVSLCH